MYFSLVLLGPKVPKASARRFPRECGLVVSPRAAKDINKDKYVSVTCALFFTPQGDSRLGSDGEKADGGLKARAAGTVCLQTRAVARRRFQTSGRRHRNRSGGFCCFSPPKSREKKRVSPKAVKGHREVFCYFSPPKSREKEKVFSCTFGAKSTKSLRTSFSAGACDPRRCTGRARSSLCATPWRTRRSSPPLFPRQTRVRIGGAADGGKVNTFRQRVLYFYPQGDSRLGSDGERAAGGLKAPAAGTVCLQTRAVARRRFQTFGRRHRNRSGGFCCFSLPKSREKRVFPEAAKGLREVFCCFSPLKSREKSFSELNVREIFGKSHPAAGCSQYVPT